MYLRADHSDNKIEIQEYFRRPTVYLDHWALNDITLHEDLRKTFIQVMNANGGTFRLSVVNITELSNQADRSQIDSILDMISSIDDCGLINIDPGEVIKKENALVANPDSIVHVKNPSAELNLVTAYIMAHNYPEHWHASEIIKSAIGDIQSKRLTKSNEEFLDDMQNLLKIGRNDSKHISMAKARFHRLKNSGPKYQTATRELLQMALDFIMRNENMKMTQYSEWNDLFHLVVPVSYCDIVLLDKRWKTFLNQTGFFFPYIAMAFDKRTIADCFKTIAGWRQHETLS
jgi:hypothetical protein